MEDFVFFHIQHRDQVIHNMDLLCKVLIRLGGCWAISPDFSMNNRKVLEILSPGCIKQARNTRIKGISRKVFHLATCKVSKRTNKCIIPSVVLCPDKIQKATLPRDRGWSALSPAPDKSAAYLEAWAGCYQQCLCDINGQSIEASWQNNNYLARSILCNSVLMSSLRHWAEG